VAAACAGGKPPNSTTASVSLPGVEAGLPRSTSPSTSAWTSTSTSPEDAGSCEGKCTGTAGDDLAKALQLHASEGRRCYNAALRTAPSLEGLIRVQVRVAADGSVCSLAAADSTMPADMTECVLDRFRGTTYPPPTDGCVDVLVPLRFKAQPGAADGGSSPSGP
jgi:hypothetical protein